MEKRLERLENIRKNKGLTRKELGQKSGIAEVTILSLELGKTNVENIKLSTLIALASALDVKVTDLVDDDILRKIA